MDEFKNFLKTKKGTFLMTAVFIAFGLVILYMLFFKDKKKAGIDAPNLETNVPVRDTTFKGRGNVYSSPGQEEKRVEANVNFFKSESEEIKQAMQTDNPTGKNSDDDLQRMADSILRANQTKVTYGAPSAKPRTSYGGSGSYSSGASFGNSKADRERQKQQEIEKFQKESRNSFDEFFEGANAKKNNSTAGSPSAYGSRSNIQNAQPSDAMIYAVVSGDQLIKNKERVTLKLTRDALINGEIYKKNTFIYAMAQFTQNRVNLNITNINQNPVSLVAQDAMDGNKGIYIEGESLLAETAGEAVDDGVRDFDIKGIPVGKTIKRVLTKKQRESQVQLLNNYKIILKTDR